MNFTDILQEHNIAYREHGDHHHTTSGWIQLDCPFCSPDSHRWRLGYNLNWHNTNCWTCGPHSALSVIAALLNISLSKAGALLGTVDTRLLTHRRPTGTFQAPDGLGPMLKPHRRYLRQRRFSTTLLSKLWGLGGIGLSTNLSWRLFIPIVYNGIPVSWTTRSISDDCKSRYISARPEQESISHKEVLFGEDYCRHAVVVVEGCFDVFRIGPGAVATLGTAYSSAQVQKLSKYPVRAVCFDNEPDAQRRARKLCQQLQCFEGTTHNVTLDAKDPGEASDKEIKQLRKRFLL